MSLNEEQKLAVEHSLDKPACLIAGAGSGKTRVLTERVRWLIDQKIPPRKICAITFTNKAAGELLARLGITEKTPRENAPWVSTIHSLALQMIRRNPRSFGFNADKITPLDDYDQSQMMKKIVEREKSDENPYKILEQIQYHRARGIGFAVEYTKEVHDEATTRHAGYHAMETHAVHFWELYEKEKFANSVVDFDDMLHLPVRRMASDPKFALACHKLFNHVLMDEAQDTNVVQWAFVNGLLSPENQNLYVVGDMSQSIYGFSGAAPELLKQYSENWRGCVPSLYRIARNHRSVPQVVNLANAIQRKMTQTIPLKMECWRGMQGEKGTTRLLRAKLPNGPSPEGVAGCIAEEILESSRRGTPYKHNAILVRTSSQIRDLEAELVRFRIPYVIRGGRGLLQTEEVRDVLAYLRIATNEKDFMALCRAVQVPRRGVGEVALETIRRNASEKFDGDLIQACSKHLKLAPFAELISDIRKASADPVTALAAAISHSKYRQYLGEKYKRDKTKLETKLLNLVNLETMIQALLEEREMTTEDVVFQLTMERPTKDDENGSVTISTVHAAKGLEWPVVFGVGINENIFPHKWSKGSEDEIEEERRLFYVLVTRARDILVLCTHGLEKTYRTSQEQVGKPSPFVYRPAIPSRFLYEVGALKVE